MTKSPSQIKLGDGRPEGLAGKEQDMKKIIRQVLKTEMDRRLERVREYLLTQEQLTPVAKVEYDKLIRRLTNVR